MLASRKSSMAESTAHQEDHQSLSHVCSKALRWSPRIVNICNPIFYGQMSQNGSFIWGESCGVNCSTPGILDAWILLYNY